MNKTNDKWSFSDSFTWSNTYPRCTASDTNTQSPINIDTDATKHCNTLCNFKTHYKSSKCFVNYKNNLIRLKYSSGSYLEYQNILYELNEITIHTPSLHSFDNYKYDLEICLIHTLSSDNRTTTTSDTPNGIILSRLYESGPHYGPSENFINQIINEIPKESINYDKEIDVSKDWSANALVPENKSFFMYDGSLPFPPCDNNYKVIVWEDIGNIGRTNLDIFKLNLGENIRNVQDLGERIVMYVPYYKDANNGSNNGSNDNSEISTNIVNNKYLKCSENPIKDLILSPVATDKVIDEVDDVGISTDTKLYLKQIFLLIIVIFIFINAIIFVKYLFKHFYAQKLLILLVGNEAMEGYLEKWNNPNCSTLGNPE